MCDCEIETALLRRKVIGEMVLLHRKVIGECISLLVMNIVLTNEVAILEIQSENSSYDKYACSVHVLIILQC